MTCCRKNQLHRYQSHLWLFKINIFKNEKWVRFDLHHDIYVSNGSNIWYLNISSQAFVNHNVMGKSRWMPFMGIKNSLINGQPCWGSRSDIAWWTVRGIGWRTFWQEIYLQIWCLLLHGQTYMQFPSVSWFENVQN